MQINNRQLQEATNLSNAAHAAGAASRVCLTQKRPGGPVKAIIAERVFEIAVTGASRQVCK